MTGYVYFLELNSRFGGTTAKVFACGYDEPLLALKAYGVKGSNQIGIRNVITSNKQALLKNIIYSIKGNLTPLDYPKESKLVKILKMVYGICKYKDDVLMLRDIRGTLALYLGNIRNSLGFLR
jgi:hypothetical protein